MGTTKAEEFSIIDNRIAMYAKALSHPARVNILKYLIQQKSCICKTIVDELPLSQSTISQHLKELKEAGLVKGEIEGASICYCIDAKNWQKANESMAKLFTSYTVSEECCNK